MSAFATTPIDSPSDDAYVNQRVAGQILGKAASVVMRYAVLGRVRVRLLRGECPRYSVVDLRRIVSEGR